jgi:hypothetical protein
VSLGARGTRTDTTIVRSGSGSNAARVVDDLLIQKTPDRVKTGFPCFDEASGGFARKDLVLMAATTGGGKSVMAEQLAINSYLFDNRRVAIVSFEMDEEEIHARLVSNLTEIAFEKVYLRRLSPQQVTRARAAWQAFNAHGERNDCSFDVWCPAYEVTPELLAKTLKPRGYDLVLVDYVGLVQGEQKAALWENLGNITRSFKLMANEQNCVVVVFAQLDEDTAKVKYSKAMKHHASYVWTWSYGEEEEERGQLTVDQTKARHCKRFPFDILANMSVMQFIAMDRGVTAKEFLARNGSPGAPVVPVPADQVQRELQDRRFAGLAVTDDQGDL